MHEYQHYIMTSEETLTDNTVEETDANDGGDCPEGIPEQQVSILEHAGSTESQYRADESTRSHVLLTAPCTVDLEPPQHTDTDNVLVKEVDDPRYGTGTPVSLVSSLR